MLTVKSLVLSISIIAQSLSISFYGLVSIPNKTGAACLDGSAPGYYIWHPEQNPVNKLLIYFQETPLGWCTDEDLSKSLEKCYKWSTSENLADSTSSNNWESNFLPMVGITSPTNGADFDQWTKVVIRSCDGGAFMGDREIVAFKGKKFHFKGTLNIRQIFKSLQTKKVLTDKQEIILAGSMNGAVAALTYSQIIKQYTSSPIRILVDSAIHIDSPNLKTNRSEFQNRMKSIQNLFFNNAPHPHNACSQANPGSQWKCMFAVELQKYVSESVFFTQALYDGWSIANILGFKCAEDFGSLSQCTEQERQEIIAYEVKVKEALMNASSKEGNGAFGIACVAHEFLSGRFLNDMFEIPMNSGNMVVNATENWIKRKNNTVLIDTVSWPNNKPCAFKAGGKRQVNLQIE